MSADENLLLYDMETGEACCFLTPAMIPVLEQLGYEVPMMQGTRVSMPDGRTRFCFTVPNDARRQRMVQIIDRGNLLSELDQRQN